MGCLFCLTGKQGFKRNLKPSEIVEQVILAKRSLEYPDRLKNIVLMGMGEPLANYDAVIKALRNLIEPVITSYSIHYTKLYEIRKYDPGCSWHYSVIRI